MCAWQTEITLPKVVFKALKTCTVPTAISMALNQAALLEYLSQQNKVVPRVVQYLEAEWGILGLSAVATKLHRHYSEKQTPGPFRSEWLASVRGNLEFAIEMNLEEALTNLTNYQAHNGAIAHAARKIGEP